MSASVTELPLQWFYRQERNTPNRVYFTQPLGGGQVMELTWSQVGDQARRMAAHLRSRGWEPGARVAIIGKNSAHWIIADLAIWMAGYVSVPLYPTLTAESVRQILDHSEANAVFVGKLDDWASMRGGVHEGIERIRLPLSPDEPCAHWDDIVRATPPLDGNPVRQAEELATIIYTSGTTGMPKGVMHSFGNLGWAAMTGNKRFGMQGEVRLLSYLPLSHIAERGAVEVISLLLGAHIFFAESLDTFAADLRRARPTFFFSVPRLWVKFQQGVFSKMPREKLDRLLRIPILRGAVRRKILAGLGLDACRLAAGGAAPMPPDLLRWYARLGLPIIEVYGMTENAAMSHSTLPGQPRAGYVGLPYPGVESRIAPDGEIQMRNGSLMLGYYKDPERTRETMTEDGWLRTGDRGVTDADGYLRITGRVKELFKTSKGKYVAPAPIENKLSAHTGIEACCVMGANTPQPFAVAILPPDRLAACRDAATRQTLVDSLATHLASVNAQLDAHEQLDFIAISGDAWTIDKGFVTPTMKIKRDAVEKHYAPHVDRWAAARTPIVWDA